MIGVPVLLVTSDGQRHSTTLVAVPRIGETIVMHDGYEYQVKRVVWDPTKAMAPKVELE